MQRVKTACDACRRRKVRCNGEQRCQQCTHLGLECRYDRSYPSSTSRAGTKRGNVVDLFKPETQRQPHQIAQISPASAAPQPQRTASWVEDKLSDSDIDARFCDRLAEDYETYVFAFLPIIPKEEFLQCISEMRHDQESSALAYALAAVTCNMRPSLGQNYESIRSEVMKLVMRALEVRGPVKPHSKLDIRTAMVSLAISVCLLAHHTDYDIAFFYLREAITCTQIIVSTTENHTAQTSSAQNSQRERLYHLLFIHERFVAVSLFRSPILPSNPLPPEPDTWLPPGICHWFNSIIRLFSVLDDKFVDNWIKKDSRRPVDFTWIQDKQAHLSHAMDFAQQHRQGLTNMQQVDLITTDLWLRTLLWRIALSKLLLTNGTSVDSMSIFFPLRLSRQLQGLLNHIPRQAFEVHGAGMIEKIFDVTNTFADILIHLPRASGSIDVTNRILDFVFLHDYLHQMSRFGETERKILEEKRDKIQMLLTQA